MRDRISLRIGVADRRLGRREGQPVQPRAGARRSRSADTCADVQAAEAHRQRLGTQTRAAARAARQAPHEPQDVAVAAAPEDLLHHREHALVDALLARLRGDAAPAQPRLERVLAVRDADAVGPVQDDRALLVGEVPPRRVHVEAVRAAHLVEHVDRDLRVDHVAGRRGDDERALAHRLRGVGDQQVGIEPVLDAEPVARRAGADGRVEREQAALDASARRAPRRAARRAAAGRRAARSASRPWSAGSAGSCAGPPRSRATARRSTGPPAVPRGRGTAARRTRSSPGSGGAPPGRWCRRRATTCPIPTRRRPPSWRRAGGRRRCP